MIIMMFGELKLVYCFLKSLLMAETNLLKWLKGKRGSGSSLKNNFSAPVMT